MSLVSLEERGTNLVECGTKDKVYKYCANYGYGVCNWVLTENSANGVFCPACSVNRTIPNLNSEINRSRWRKIEVAKHRLIYSFLRLKLPFNTPDHPLVFDFKEETDGEKIITGHADGVITINIAEADEVERTKNKQDLGERYRTLLGHFRHESGHYFWDVLIRDDHEKLQGFRHLFGDERKDYNEALKAYYNSDFQSNWMNNFISPYATAHPWEDWAESWAHYLHMMDTLETAFAFGLGINPENEDMLTTQITKDPYEIKNFTRLVKMWLPLTFALNSLNRSMGHQDFYPFVISAPVIEKLSYIHELCLNHEPVYAITGSPR